MKEKFVNESSKELGFNFDQTLFNNLMIMRAAVLNQDYDCCIVVDGGEGKGKSVLAFQVAYAMDCERSIDVDTQVCFSPEEFKKAVTSLKKGKAIIYDEARRGLNSRRSMTSVNQELTDMLAESRQRNLFVIIVMPSFYDMDKNISVWRTRALLHVTARWNPEHKEKPLIRGFFRFYNESGKKKLRANPYWMREYKYPNLREHCFNGRFIKHYVFDESRYRERKSAALKNFEEKEKKVVEKPAEINYSSIPKKKAGFFDGI